MLRADLYVNMNVVDAPTTTLTPTIMAAGTQGAAITWVEGLVPPDTGFSVGAHQRTLGDRVLLVDGTSYADGSTTKALAVDHAFNQIWQNAAIPGSHKAGTSFGWLFVAPPDAGAGSQLIDYIAMYGAVSGDFSTLQLDNGRGGAGYGINIETNWNGSINATTHSAYITLTPATWYWYCYTCNFNSGISQLGIWTEAGALVGYVTCTQTSVSNVPGEFLGNWKLGNNEVGTASGTTSYLEHPLLAYQSGGFPITPWQDPTPVLVGVGDAQASVTTATPVWPPHIAGDVALLFVESCGGEPVTLSTPAGFVAIPKSPQATGAGTAGTQLSIFWCRATSSAMANPVVADPGDHVYARILTFANCVAAGDPWNTVSGSVKPGASTTTTCDAVTTTVDRCLIVFAAARDTDTAVASWTTVTNAALAFIAEAADEGTALGNGGGLVVGTGTKAAAGATGTTSLTVASAINAQITIALRPATLVPAIGAHRPAPWKPGATPLRGY